MPQVAQGWEPHYLLFGREGFTEATQAAAQELNGRLVSLHEIEKTLGAA
jgi:hypothetical protein